MPSFAEVYEEHVFKVYAFIAYRVRSRDDAEDLTQQTFEKALRAWPRFDPRRASVTTWLLVIARNVVIDRHRAAHAGVPLDDVPEAALPAELDTSAELAANMELAGALAALSPRDREVVALRFGADLTGPGIASVTGLSLANVQQILSRSLRRLRAELEDPRHSPASETALRDQ